MKMIIQRINMWQSYYISFLLVALSFVAAVVLYTSKVQAANYVELTSQVQLGDKNNNVTNLQMFLASNSSVYPEGLVTGYFGPLTKEAVIRFQNQYGIDPVGRVGPLTLGKINALIRGGGWNGTADVSGPRFYSVYQRDITSTSITFNWTTDELATAKIFYYTNWITMNEGDIDSTGFGATNGLTASNDGVARTAQQVTISGLQPKTQYHYVIVSTDQSGNVSVWNPNITFTTAP